jgi:hypothetical protein
VPELGWMSRSRASVMVLGNGRVATGKLASRNLAPVASIVAMAIDHIGDPFSPGASHSVNGVL